MQEFIVCLTFAGYSLFVDQYLQKGHLHQQSNKSNTELSKLSFTFST